jgi:hypothetical protein
MEKKDHQLQFFEKCKKKIFLDLNFERFSSFKPGSATLNLKTLDRLTFVRSWNNLTNKTLFKQFVDLMSVVEMFFDQTSRSLKTFNSKRRKNVAKNTFKSK